MKLKNLIFLCISLINIISSMEKSPQDLEIITTASKEDLKKFVLKISKNKIEIKQKLGIDPNNLENYDNNDFYPQRYSASFKSYKSSK